MASIFEKSTVTFKLEIILGIVIPNLKEKVLLLKIEAILINCAISLALVFILCKCVCLSFKRY